MCNCFKMCFLFSEGFLLDSFSAIFHTWGCSQYVTGLKQMTAIIFPWYIKGKIPTRTYWYLLVLFLCATGLHLTNPEEFSLHCMKGTYTQSCAFLEVLALSGILAMIGLFVTFHALQSMLIYLEWVAIFHMFKIAFFFHVGKGRRHKY